MSRFRKRALFIAAAAILAAVALYVVRGDSSFEGLEVPAARAPAFTLEAPYRGPVTLSDLAGHAVLLTFGRPSCGDACNPQLATVTDALTRLGDRRERVRALYVALDDDGIDDPGLLAFLQAHDLGLTGLRGDADATRSLARAYRAVEATASDSVRAAAGLGDPADAPRIFGIDPSGVLRVVWATGQAERIARDTRLLLRR